MDSADDTTETTAENTTESTTDNETTSGDEETTEKNEEEEEEPFVIDTSKDEDPAIPLDIGKHIRLNSKNYPENFLRHRSEEIWVDEDDGTVGFLDDSQFTVARTTPQTGEVHVHFPRMGMTLAPA